VYVDIPDISEVNITICGEIAQANDYPGTMLYMKYAIVTPKGKKIYTFTHLVLIFFLKCKFNCGTE